MFKKIIFLITLPIGILFAEALSTTIFDLNTLVNEFEQKENNLKRHINLSGKQRMLTQQMTKLTIQIAENIHKKESISTLKKISLLYDTTLQGFKNGNKTLKIEKATSSKIIAQIETIRSLWQPFYTQIQHMIEGKQRKEALAYIISHNEALLEASDTLVSYYEAINTSKDYLETIRLHIINVAGRQRMLTQKMTKEKLLALQGNKSILPTLQKTISIFDTSLKALKNGDKAQNILMPSNSKIINQLTVISKLWNNLKPLYEKENITQNDINRIITQNPILLRETNYMVTLAETVLEY